VVGVASNVLLAGGGVLFDAACGSGPWSHQFTHARLPSADPVRKLAAGDLFHVDCYGAYGGYFFDFARSRCVGDEPTAEQRELLEAVIGGVGAMCEAIRPGVTAGDVFTAGDEFLSACEAIRQLPKDEPALVSFPALGHGIGLGWEGPYLAPGDETVLEPGMVIAVEILTGHPSVGGAMFEENGIVAEDGFEIITPARRRWWD
jgi:Xaa-Pro aminopeptidase